MQRSGLLCTMVLATSCIPTPDFNSLVCHDSVYGYCQSKHCDPAEADAEQDIYLCDPGTTPLLYTCGEYKYIARSTPDGKLDTWYRNDQLYAVVTGYHGISQVCAAGPSTFELPPCDVAGTPLPACQGAP